MNYNDLLEKYKPLLKRHWLPLLLGFLGLIFFVYGLIYLLGSPKASNDVVFEPAERENTSVKSEKIVVDIEGAVAKPGVYELQPDSRLQDALVASGGLSAQADRQWAVSNLNLALKLKDGVKIYIPKTGEVLVKQNNNGISGSNALIDINSASEQELDSLPNVGPATAQKIINGRPYNSIEELLEKKAVGNSVFEKIKEKITAY